MDILDYGIILQESDQGGGYTSYIAGSDDVFIYDLPGQLYEISYRGKVIGNIIPKAIFSEDKDHTTQEEGSVISIWLPPFKSTTLRYKYSKKQISKLRGCLLFKTVLKRYMRDSRLEGARGIHNFGIIEDALGWSQNYG